MARRILLADDSVTAQNMGRKILTDAGYEVVAVNNGSAALKKIAEHKPDIIVLDVYMPGYSGLEVCQRIKENRETARIPVLLTVGKLEPFKPEEARKARADAFVVKPFEASELLTALTKLEDKIVPTAEPYKQGRFAKAVATVEDEASESGEKFGDKDQGWRSRLRFPSRKQKQSEPEEAPDNATVGGKDFRDSPPVESVRAAEPPTQAKPASASKVSQEFERPVPSGLPHDITPEEIAAITAAATKLSGGTAEVVPEEERGPRSAEPPVPVSEVVSPAITPSAAVDAAGAAPSKPSGDETHSRVSEAVAAATGSVVEQVPVFSVEPAIAPSIASEEVAPATFASAPDLEIEGQNEVAVPPTAVPEPAVAAREAEEELKVEAASDESPSGEQSKSALEEAEQAKPISTAPVEYTPVVEDTAEPPVSKIVEQVMTASADEPFAPVAPTVKDEPPTAVLSSSTVAEAEEARPIEHAHVSDPAASEHHPAPAAPGDDDVMAALQSLIPPPSPGAATASALLGSASTINDVDLSYIGSPSSSPRWMAEEMAPSSEESGVSLEREMESACAAFAASEAARLLASSVLDTFPGTQAVVPTATAVEGAPVSDVQTPPEPKSAVAAETAPIAEPTAEPTPAYAMASAAGAGEDGAARTAKASTAPAEPVSDVPAVVHEAASAAAVSMPAAGVHETEIVPAEPVPAPAIDEESSLAGGTDDMDRKHSESLGFKMIRQSPAATKGAAKAEPVSKENFEPTAASAEPAAMAAAAAAESAPASPAGLSVADPKAIASIVDSVLAELRPKIVEEIAKKLAGDGKKE